MKCTGCKKDKSEDEFKKGDKIMKKCDGCRNTAKLWREKNKERVAEYNKMYNGQQKDGTTIDFVYGKLKDAEEWVKYDSQRDAAKKLKLFPANINKVIKGSLKTTGGYVFKIDNEVYECKGPDWEKIKEKHGFGDLVTGCPSQQRVIHETIDDVIGKKCCTCKEWQPLAKYNNHKKHWDQLRNDCKSCLKQYRKKNTGKMSKYMTEYDKKRKKIDPNYKLRKTLRSRIGCAISRIKAKKHMNTMELTGCSINYLKKYFESLFEPGMTWKNHGEWHIDHIIPCSSWDLTKLQNQQVCFNYRNLQPLWEMENLEKHAKYNKKDKEKLIKKVLGNISNNMKVMLNQIICKILKLEYPQENPTGKTLSKKKFTEKCKEIFALQKCYNI
jgi:biotin operon repressor